MTYRVQLEKYTGPKSRHTCPKCRYSNTFTYYIDTFTGNPISPKVGRCNREIECGYHLTPKQFIYDGGSFVFSDIKLEQITLADEIKYIPQSFLIESLSRWDQNNFYKFLCFHLDNKYVESIMTKYLVGTSHHWNGATIFWQKDILGRVRQAKVILYDPISGKRTKSDQPAMKYSVYKNSFYEDKGKGDKVTFLGKRLVNDETATFKQCFFGEHLLDLEDTQREVGVVESEKTAIIASIFMPQYIWIATGGINGCKWRDPDVFEVLKNHDVVLFPDVGGYNSWNEASQRLRDKLKCNIVTTNRLEDLAQGSSVYNGWDLADFILKSNVGTNTWVGPDGYPLIWDRPSIDFIK